MTQWCRFARALLPAVLCILLLALPACKKSPASNPASPGGNASAGSSPSEMESEPEPPWPVESGGQSPQTDDSNSKSDLSSSSNAASGEDEEERPEAADPDLPYIEADGYTVILGLTNTHFSEEEINGDGFEAEYTLFNTSSQSVNVSTSYHIEYYGDDGWVPFPFDFANPPAWTDGDSIRLGPGDQLESSFTYWNTHAPMEYGNYRIIQAVTVGEHSFTIYAPFRVQ